jgi:hypothetical protein
MRTPNDSIWLQNALALIERPDALREFLELQHHRSVRDFVIVDRNRMVVAHAAGEKYALGEKFDHDPGCV